MILKNVSSVNFCLFKSDKLSIKIYSSIKLLVSFIKYSGISLGLLNLKQ